MEQEFKVELGPAHGLALFLMGLSLAFLFVCMGIDCLRG
jgi:hypothetical protein